MKRHSPFCTSVRRRNASPVSTSALVEPLERRDCPASFSLAPVVGTVVEGQAAEFRITMATRSMIPQAVIVSTEGITAALGSDYMHRTERITFFPGETEKTFLVQSLRDPLEVTEGAETLRVIVKPVDGSPAQLTTIVTIDDYTPAAQFEITFNFADDVPQAVITASAAAAQRWTEIIVGDLPDVFDPTYGLIDDILVTIQMGLLPDGDTDGDGNTLANAGPRAWRNGGAGLPYLADVGIDPADADRADLTSILIHEFAHALGFPGTDTFQSYIEGGYFVGANAVREYKALFGGSANPLGVPMEAGGGEGTAYGHWSESVFGNELLTGFINPSGNPISRITVGAFADIGYTVNYAAADAYSPPGGAPVAPASSPPASPTRPLNQPLTEAPSLPSPSLPISTASAGAPPIGPISKNVSIRHQLPARITFPDRTPVILANTSDSRALILASLSHSGTSANPVLIDLRGLSSERRAALAAWVAYDDFSSSLQDYAGVAYASQTTNTGKPTTRRALPLPS